MTDKTERTIPESFYTFGEIPTAEVVKWRDYLSLGVTQEHIPDLIRICTDLSLYDKDDSDPAAWAPVHAWRALGQLKAVDAAAPLTVLFHQQADNEWVFRDIPQVYVLIGPKALPALKAYIDDPTHSEDGLSVAFECMSKIAQANPINREVIASIFEYRLREYEKQFPFINSCLILELCNMKSYTSWPVIREALQSGRIDYQICGNDIIIQIRLGLLRPDLFPYMDSIVAGKGRRRPTPPVQKAAPAEEKPEDKEKKRRKLAGKSRQRNRKS